jgi:hypothetical protein
MGSSFKRNKIINGDMRVDQRNAGASVTPTVDAYTLDRWAFNTTQASKISIQQNAGSVTPPIGFTKYLGVTSLSAYSVVSSDFFLLQQPIEGFNVADLNWGTANAATITLSFWVRSSLTGTFGGSLVNSSVTRSYPFTYSISSANTWEQKYITVAGDTSGTWLSDNSVGIRVYFGLGAGSTKSGSAGSWAGADYRTATGATSVVGTDGATFYITGVQLEVGSVATPYERQIYSEQLAQCQRYYYRSTANNSNWLGGAGYASTTIAARTPISFPVTMRIAPTSIDTSGTASNYRILPAGVACSAVPAINLANTSEGWLSLTVASGLTANAVATLAAAADVSTAYIGWSAEL